MTKHFSKLRKDKANYLVPTPIIFHITAVRWAKQERNGVITLGYSDETTESAPCDRDMVTEFDGFLPVVNYVQSQRQV